MGNFCTISISCDQLLSGCLDFTFRKAVYISKLKENVDGLKIAVEGLTDLHNDVTRRVKVDEEQQLKRLDQVQRWISRAEAAIDRANELLREDSQEIERLCLRGYCSKNYKSSYRFAKEVDKRLRDVADLKANGDFKVVAEKVPAASGVARPSEPTVGLESTFNQVWTCLREEKQVGIVGLYGMGGVGKTTLLTQINNESLKTLDYFDIVIWVVVSKDLKLNTVQESIGRNIGCSDDLWKNKSLDEKAVDIFNALRHKREVVENWGYHVIGCLLHACLLEDKDDCVRMHDVIRDMALWIASDIERDQQNFFVQTGAQSSKAPEVGKWEGGRKVSFMANHIEHLSETPNCSNLQTLFLGSIHLKKISRGFFQFMPKLTVLDLSNNISLVGLPRDVWKLVSLQYLNLSRTGIKELPTELNELVKLRYLNLEYTHSLYLLPHGVISGFPMMRILRMFRCGSSEQAAEDCILSRDESLVEELQCLGKLNMLTVTIRSAAALERLSSFQGMQSSTRVLYLELFHDSKLVNFSSLANMKNLDTLHICHCGSLEELQIDWEGELQKMQAINNLAQVVTTERPFRSLSSVYVENCLKLSNLTWLILAQNLTFLRVSNCPKLVELASVEKLPEVPELVENLNPFAKLKAVELLSLPNLKSFYWNALPLPSVKDVRVVDCPFLDKRPLDTSRANQ
ncbi:hypothetical protein H0E87_001120 [Populus deltoides]|uniref:NB-ARC domain-containing protein n=1 Tax=Populus deltoides TaxID=3696 RepID=A0A8T2ZQC7_POPDE|nr:hypothetical protein H0E87_001120 [Populus deltoides]